MAGQPLKLMVQLDKRSLARLTRALDLLGEDRATWLRDAWDDVGRHFAGAVRNRAPGSMGGTVVYLGINKSTTIGGIKAMGGVRHPGAKSYEFGREKYWTGFKRPGGKHSKYIGGHKEWVRRGYPERPYIGVKSQYAGATLVGASADVMPYAQARLKRAADEMWERIATGAND